MASTTAPKERNRERVAEPSRAARQKAAGLIDDADRLVAEALSPGRWPQAKTVGRFLEDGKLERLLSLYSQAMWLDGTEPAYPWNLSSTLRRLGQYELASAFLTRAIHTASQADDDDFSGADSYLALAEIAVDSSESDAAMLAIARALELGGGRDDIKQSARRLLTELNGDRARGKQAGRSLVRLLENLES